ncbi:carboxymuconolactone decarboxylase family protein [Virgibacillus sp. DJP39]|uniref:carboxymuconolactone decarboxylase family protein n=1 Tax=Virgibacillus sp. DJP39 TaxID=3409790 RepID=UPI003BB54BA3
MHSDEIINYFDQSINDYKQGSTRMEKQFPEMTKGYFNFTQACFEEGSVAKKEKQLIALGISIYSQDEYCIIYHVKGAVEHGATQDEIMETIAISAALGGGAAFSQGVTLTMDTFDYYSDKKMEH